MSKATLTVLSECIPIFAMLQDENRQHILMLLFDNNSMTVSELTNHLALSRPAVSHHLKLLLDCGLIRVVKNGKERIYSLSMDKAIILLKSLLESLEKDLNLTPA